jgi:hypothetical protein
LQSGQIYLFGRLLTQCLGERDYLLSWHVSCYTCSVWLLCQSQVFRIFGRSFTT